MFLAFAVGRAGTVARIGFLTLETFAGAREGRFVVLVVFGLCLVDTTLLAFCARAFPAGERLVAGRSRVDFFPASLRDDDALDALREEDREEDRLVVMLMN